MPVVATTAFPTGQQAAELVRSLLNDADLPSVSNITATGAVRASNVVTITTASAHGLQIGDRVTISGVTDTTFNGTQTVASVPTSTTFTYSQTAGNASSGNGVAELLIQGDVFTDSVLLPFINKGFRKVQRLLLARGSRTMSGETMLRLAAGDTYFSDIPPSANTNPLPDDFLAARELQERTYGSSEAFTDMEETDVLPQAQVPSSRLGIWATREDGLYFVGATGDREVFLRYFKGQPDIASMSGQLRIRGCLDAVADWAAALAATSRGADAATFYGMFQEDFAELKSIQSHARQSKPVRRRPYNGARRGFYF